MSYYRKLIVNSTWTPADITTSLWLDASDTSTLWANTAGTVPATSDVQRWDDKSGNSNHMTGTLNSVFPQTGTLINELNTLTFNNCRSFIPNRIITSFPFEIYTVSLISAGNGIITSIVESFSAGNWDGVLEYFGGNIRYMCRRNAFQPQAIGNFPYTENQLYLSQGGSYGSTNRQLIVNADLKGTGTNNSFRNGTNRFAIGCLADSSPSASLNGKICEVIVLDYQASTADRERIEGYLAWKWGIESDLPTSHPYKINPPFF